VIENPYYDLWAARDFGRDSLDRHNLTVKYSWAVPDEGAILYLAGLGPIIEVGAGTGYWASLIAAAGGDIIATDITPPGSDVAGCRYTEHALEEAHFQVRRIEQATAAARYPERTLMLCWPREGHTAVEAYHAAGGKRVVFIGEVHGCTGSDQLMIELGHGAGRSCPIHDWLDDEGECYCGIGPTLFEEVENIEIPQWDGMHDWLYLYERV
jgi:hypothetical protein